MTFHLSTSPGFLILGQGSQGAQLPHRPGRVRRHLRPDRRGEVPERESERPAEATGGELRALRKGPSLGQMQIGAEPVPIPDASGYSRERAL